MIKDVDDMMANDHVGFDESGGTGHGGHGGSFEHEHLTIYIYIYT